LDIVEEIEGGNRALPITWKATKRQKERGNMEGNLAAAWRVS
jgi:hypothetical protein